MNNLTNHLLIAPPNMPDPRFAESVVYIARHDKHGAFGFVINQPLNMSAFELFSDININVSANFQQNFSVKEVLLGGPVRPEVGFVLHTGLPDWQSSVAITENICFTTSKDILQAIAENNSVSHFQICLGHASWQTKQLEAELAAGGWFAVAADSHLLFKLPFKERWQAAAQKAGINFNWLVDDVGSA